MQKRKTAAISKMHTTGRAASILYPIVIALLVIVLVLIGGAFSKYLRHTGGGTLVKAKEFYFTSDYLSPEGKTYTLNPGTSSVTFELRNNDGLNVSDLDITYTVSVESDASADAQATVTCSGDRTITVSEQKETVTIGNLRSGQTYTVTVTGSNGYESTLKATFKVEASKIGIFKNTANYADYVLLTVWAQGASGVVTFTVPTGLIPDATNDALTGKVAGSTVEVSLEEFESMTFRFFTTAAYTGDDVTVTAGGTTLPETELN